MYILYIYRIYRLQSSSSSFPKASKSSSRSKSPSKMVWTDLASGHKDLFWWRKRVIWTVYELIGLRWTDEIRLALLLALSTMLELDATSAVSMRSIDNSDRESISNSTTEDTIEERLSANTGGPHPQQRCITQIKKRERNASKSTGDNRGDI